MRPPCWTCCTGACMASGRTCCSSWPTSWAPASPGLRASARAAPHLTALAARARCSSRPTARRRCARPRAAAMLTGRLPSPTGVYDNAAELAGGHADDRARCCAPPATRTALAGKMHFVGPDQLHGFEERLTTRRLSGGLRLDAGLAAAGRRRGSRGTTTPTSLLSGRVRRGGDADRLRRRGRASTRCRSSATCRAAATDGRSSSPSRSRIRTTHGRCGARHWDLYDEGDGRAGGAGDAARAGGPAQPAPARHVRPRPPPARRGGGAAGAAWLLRGDQLPRRAHRRGAGRAARGDRARRDTMVVFTADHGELLGERGLWYKMSFLDPIRARAAHRPRPGVRGRAHRADCVSQLDLAPTLAELAGATGRRRRLRGPQPARARWRARPWPGEAFAEYLAEGVRAPAVMIRRGRHKYVRCRGDPDLLYDLEADPHEVAQPGGRRRRRQLAADFRGRVPTSAGISRARARRAREPALGGESWRGRWPSVRTTPGTTSPGSTPPGSTSAATRPARHRPGERPLGGELSYAPRIASATSGTSVTTWLTAGFAITDSSCRRLLTVHTMSGCPLSTDGTRELGVERVHVRHHKVAPQASARAEDRRRRRRRGQQPRLDAGSSARTSATASGRNDVTTRPAGLGWSTARTSAS